VSRVLRASIAHGLAHRAEAIDWLLSIGSALPDAAAVDHYLSLYANDDTLDYGEDGRRAVEVLLAEGAAAGLLPACPPVDWAP
jgi:1,4-dihydroxy-6-naphthoate synthase